MRGITSSSPSSLGATSRGPASGLGVFLSYPPPHHPPPPPLVPLVGSSLFCSSLPLRPPPFPFRSPLSSAVGPLAFAVRWLPCDSAHFCEEPSTDLRPTLCSKLRPFHPTLLSPTLVQVNKPATYLQPTWPGLFQQARLTNQQPTTAKARALPASQVNQPATYSRQGQGSTSKPA